MDNNFTTNFITGIPEIDRLTGSRIENGSFLLAAGNDDEGMLAFLAEIIKIYERQAEKGKNESNGCRIVKIDSDNRESFDRFCNPSDDEKNQNLIFIIESISELFYSEFYERNIPFEEQEIINKIHEIGSILRKRNESAAENKADNFSVLIGCLHENTFPMITENRIKHISDIYFRFNMENKGSQFERMIEIYKYKGGNAGGKILRYTLEDGKIQIETKKRIY